VPFGDVRRARHEVGRTPTVGGAAARAQHRRQVEPRAREPDGCPHSLVRRDREREVCFRVVHPAEHRRQDAGRPGDRPASRSARRPPKGVAYLPRYAAVSATANHRYLDALAVVDDPAPASEHAR